MTKEYKRWQVENTKKALQNRRVVVISGARQTGKTTLVTQVADKDVVFRTLDDAATLLFAQKDPRGFVKHDKKTMIIDEIQKAPELISEIKLAVDKDNRNGQYLLTGSSNIQTLPIISDSLAGRISHIRLRPLTNGEILGAKPKFLEMAFNGEFPVQIKGYDKRTVFDLAFRGGYPEAARITDISERKQWHLDYILSMLKKDLKDIENIKRQNVLFDLVKILAGWSSKYMDAAKIGAFLSLSKITFDSYINALEQMFVYERVAPWIKTDYEYIGKKHKFFTTDTGLMASILDWQRDDVLGDAEITNSDRVGKLMETLVFQELSAQIDIERSGYSLRQYRDYKKHEIDFLIERPDGAIAGVEVKASSSVLPKDFAPQKWFQENIIKNKVPYCGIVLYTGQDTLSFGGRMFAVPAASLWV